jgi:hypothetical protein
VSLPAAAVNDSHAVAAAAKVAASAPVCTGQAAHPSARSPPFNKHQQRASTASVSLKNRKLPLALQKLFADDPALSHQDCSVAAAEGRPDSAKAASSLTLPSASEIKLPSTVPPNQFKPSRMPQKLYVASSDDVPSTTSPAQSKGKRMQHHEQQQEKLQIHDIQTLAPPSTAIDSFRRCALNLLGHSVAKSTSAILRDAVCRAVVSSFSFLISWKHFAGCESVFHADRGAVQAYEPQETSDNQ